MGVAREAVGGAALGDRVYAVGGRGATAPTAVVEAYDTIADRWSSVAPLPAPLSDVAVAALDGVLYACGGLVPDGSAVASVSAYDPATDAWTKRAPLPSARGGAAAAAFAGRLYVAGGLRDGIAVGDFAAYDPASDTWTTLPVMPHSRHHLGLAATDVLVYAVGGSDGVTPLTIGEAFHPPGNEWFKEVAPLLAAREGLALTALGGRLFAFGGLTDGINAFAVVAAPEMFDPSRNSWFFQPDMPTPRHGAAAVPVGARIYVIGGAAGSNDGTSGVTEVFLPPTADTLDVRRLALAKRGQRLRLAVSLGDAASEDPTVAPLRIRVREGDADVFGVTLATGALVAKGRGWRPATDALPRGTVLSIRRRQALVLRLAGPTLRRPGTRHGLAVAVELGARRFVGTVR